MQTNLLGTGRQSKIFSEAHKLHCFLRKSTCTLIKQQGQQQNETDTLCSSGLYTLPLGDRGHSCTAVVKCKDV